MSLLRATGLCVPAEDGGRPPLAGPVELELGAGQVLAIDGPSGCGKTTLLRALSLLEPLAQGEVSWQGRGIADADTPAYRRAVQYLPQRAALGVQSVEQALRKPFELRTAAGQRYDAGRARALLDALLLPAGITERDVAEISGGEAQRVALVRSLLTEPTVLLLDEPTSALDETSVLAAERAVQDWLSAAPRAAVLITHDAAQRARMATHRRSFDAERRLAPETAAS